MCCAILVPGSAPTAQAAGRKPSDLLAIAKEVGKVTGVIDGDTIQVTIDNKPYTVRYIGIDAPALNECYGAQARAANAALVQGQTVRLQNDVNEYDASGQYLLRYVYLLNGTMTSESLAGNGYAPAVASSPNIKNQGTINDFEAQARTARKGGWSACGWKSTVVKAPGTCVTIPAEILAEPGPRPAEVNNLKDGECLTILKAANVEGPEWSGQFIYHPAGTQLKLADMYVRWKDAIVMITIDENGTALAHVVKDSYWKPRWGKPPSPDQVPGSRRVYPQPLERDSGQPEMLQIPDPRTWLFRGVGNDTYEALVDVFVYKSGEMRAIYKGVSDQLR